MHCRARVIAWLLALLCVAATGRTHASDSSAIERGRYVAIAANCAGCHTRPGGAAFAGGLPIETPLGTIHSTNITPDPVTGIGNWSAADFRRALREGIAADGRHLFPAFPYPSYTRMEDSDIADLHAWLQTLEPVTYTPPDNDWPFALRWTMAIWNRLFLQIGPRALDTGQTSEWNRGRYLVEGPGHCGACHTPRNLLLAERADAALAGALVEGPIAKSGQRAWFAVDLRSTAQGLAAWRVDDLVRYFATGASARGGVAGPMVEVVGGSLQRLQTADQRAIAVYLKSLQGSDYSGPVVDAALAQAGDGIYAKRCSKCHGKSGRGGFFSGPPLAQSAVVQGESPATLINLILYGPLEHEGLGSKVWERMPAYGKALDDAAIAAVANHVRGNWGNRARAVSAEEVSAQR